MPRPPVEPPEPREGRDVDAPDVDARLRAESERLVAAMDALMKRIRVVVLDERRFEKKKRDH